ncbi:xanthine dehydrogenase family protein molybdopterin-binding subunit [Parafrankia sp. EUN1f]|uniref:xanthine dehydrogenase family protein molybdopterin-binding subunit n=1 Tax=Parafrankia sp. EUN1f TaxID=102897 RepID=UPI0001C45E78|nr:xanthine dehydrogenase family protein molybdopterin-binding subunit [Parafrankia sp. EUN1f]EFC82781.1 aldehyde oxidase and xanthine dehydrogenase molybdopterin binding [Parafrankia sp. EUN1f]
MTTLRPDAGTAGVTRSAAGTRGETGGRPTVVGTPARRREDDRLLRGRGRFVADLRLPGQAQAVFVRSTEPHALLRAVDVSAARGDRRAVAVLSAADFPGGPPLLPSASGPVPGLPTAQPALATDRVRYVGEPVAVVVAADRYAAEDLADLVRVDYAPLPVVADLDAALRPGAPTLHPRAADQPGGPPGTPARGDDGAARDDSAGRGSAPGWGDNVEQVVRAVRGDVTAALAAAPLTFSVRLSIARQAGAPMETRGVVADWDRAAGRLTVWTPTQIPHGMRDAVAAALGLPADAVRVVLPDVGGAFGTKMQPYPEEFVVAWLSRLLGRPVGWVEDRAEHTVATVHGRDQHHDVEVGHDASGRILAIRDRMASDIGAYSFTNAAVEAIATPAAVPGLYRVPAYAAESLAVFTNKTPAGPFRGVGAAPATFVMERIVDLVAAQVGVDPAEVRLRNLIGPDELPYGPRTTLHLTQGSMPWPPHDSGDYPGLLRRALDLVGYRDLRREQAQRRASDPAGPLFGVGLGMFVEPSGDGKPELARLRVDEYGVVEVAAGLAPSGQGHETMLAQIVADELRIPLDDVVVRLGDTDRLRWGAGTMASRSAAVGGGAVRLAARALVERAVPVAARLLGVPASAVALTEHGFGRTDGTGAALDWASVAQAAGPTTGTGELAAEAEFRPAGIPFGYGVHVSVVEVDPGTGVVTALRHRAFDDCGTVLNPMMLAGQVHGGIGFAIGNALFEELPYTDDGFPLAGAAGYPLPTVSSMPADVWVAHAQAPAPPAAGRGGGDVKGAGEGGVIGGTAAIANAVADALAHRPGPPPARTPARTPAGTGAGGTLAFPSLPGIVGPEAVTRIPLTPPEVLRLLRAQPSPATGVPAAYPANTPDRRHAPNPGLSRG